MSLEEFKYFFSYTRGDSEFVLKLAKELRAVGANLWLDQLDILGGQHWDSTVEKALKSCKGMIVVLSPESVASDNVMDEVSYALDEGKLVVPVVIRSCDIPLRLRRVQYIDFTADYDRGFTQLLKALGIEQPVQPPESVEPLKAEKSSRIIPADLSDVKKYDPKTRKLLRRIGVSEPIPDELVHAKPAGLETEKAWSKSQKTKVLATICIVTLIAIVSIVIFRKYLKTYSLTCTAVDGKVTKSLDKTRYNHGEEVTLEAVANTGYSFANWSDDLSGSTNPVTLAMDADKSVTANFTLKTYSLTTTADPNGSVTKSPDRAVYKHGEEVTLEGVPNKGYSFKNWSGDLFGSTNPAMLVMDADKSVTASFTLKTYSLTATADPNGSVTKSPDRAIYKNGETVILEAVPNMEYNFTNWSGDLSGSTNPATLVMDADKSVTANFAPSEAGEFIPLFNGKDLSGWKASGEEGGFTVRDGMIVGQNGPSHLFYVGPVENANFRNFEFEAEVMTEPGANGGVFFHTAYQESGRLDKDYEAQIDNNDDSQFKTGSLYGIGESRKSPVKDNEWFTLNVTVQHKQIIIKVNGENVVDYIEPEQLHDPDQPEKRLSSGTFALQTWYPERVVYYRNIMVKPLPLEPSVGDVRREAEKLVLRLMRALQSEDVETLVQLSPPPLFANMKVLTSAPDIRDMYRGYFDHDEHLLKHGRPYVDRIMSGTIREYKDLGHLEEDDPLLSQMPLDDDDIVVIMTGHWEDGTDVRSFLYFRRLDGHVKLAGFRPD